MSDNKPLWKRLAEMGNFVWPWEDLKMDVRKVVHVVIVCGLIVGGWFGLRGCNKKVDKGVINMVLGPQDTHKLIIDPKKHTLTDVSHKGITVQYLPNTPTGIVVKKTGEIVVLGRKGGTEFSPSLGFAYSDTARLFLGAGLLSWQKWELNLGLAPTVSGRFSLTAIASISYNIYSNTSLFVGIDTRHSPVGGITFKL